MSSSRSGLPSRSMTASMPCWRGSGPIAACSLRRQAVDHELGERACFSGHAERGVPGAGQRPGGPHDLLQHVPHGQLAGHRQNHLADVLEDLVLAGIGGPAALEPRPYADGTGAARGQRIRRGS